jgi:hypothetical protein
MDVTEAQYLREGFWKPPPEARFEFDPETNHLIYKGDAPPGTLTSQADWRITLYEYGEDGNFSHRRTVLNAIWDNRASYFV